MREPVYYFRWAALYATLAKAAENKGDAYHFQIFREHAVYYLAEGLAALALSMRDKESTLS